MTKPNDEHVETPPDADPAGSEEAQQESKAGERPTPFADTLAELRGELERESEAAEGDEEEAGAAGAAGEAGEGDEEEAGAAGAAGEAGEDEFVVVPLPGRQDGDEDFELPLDRATLEAAGIDPKQAEERLRQLRNGFVRGEKVRAREAELDQQQAELDHVYDEMQADPAAFLGEHVRPEVRAKVAEELLLGLEDDAFGQLVKRIDGWLTKPEARDTDRVRAENRRLQGQGERRDTTEKRQALNDQVRKIHGAITDLVPDGMDGARANRFLKLAASELQAYVQEHKLSSLDHTSVPDILRDRGVLEDYQIPATDSSNGGASSDAPTKPGERSGAGGKSPPSSAATSSAEGGGARERLKRRRSATTTPAGAGAAAPAGFQKVPGETYKDRRNRLARALGLPEKQEL